MMPIYGSATMSNRLLGSSFTIQNTVPAEKVIVQSSDTDSVQQKSVCSVAEAMTRSKFAGIFMDAGEKRDPPQPLGRAPVLVHAAEVGQL